MRLGHPDAAGVLPARRPVAAWAAIAAEVALQLDRRLARDEPAPVVVALSGGGDSLALLLAAQAWARGAGRAIVAATVDHRLAAQSAAWTTACRLRCEALGVDHLSLVWMGPPPATGLAAAARAARHRLLAEAARSLGARVILLGHTADDVAEAALMREAGATTPAPGSWTPSPVWPEGRGLFLLRPLLGERRAAVRAALASVGERWIDDPANDDPASARAQARTLIAAGRSAHADPQRPGPCPGPFAVGPAGELEADAAALAGAPAEQARGWLGAALVCAAGRERPPRTRALDRVRGALGAGAPVAVTLAGARLWSDGRRVLIGREIADPRSGAVGDLRLRAGEIGVWDGRYQVRAGGGDLTVTPLAGRLSRLSQAQQRRARALDPRVRPTLPAFVGADGSVSCPIFDDRAQDSAICLVRARLAAACGEVDHETAIVAWRTWEPHPKSVGMSGKRPVDEPS